MQRRLAAIMIGDIVGYSALMERSEDTALARLFSCDDVIGRQVNALDGRIFNKAGDATLAEFPSPINALRCAVEIGAGLSQVEGDPPIKMRFGVHLADVAVRGDDLLGDGVNLAARLQQGAPAGAVWVSGTLFDSVRRNSPYIFDDLGPKSFKNLSEPIRVYQVRGEMGVHRLQASPNRAVSGREKRPNSLAVMPFRVQGGEEEQRFLAEGLTEELIVELGRFRRLSAASRSASFAIPGNARDPVKVGEALGVEFVLDGQVRKQGAELRIALTLADTESGSVFWSGKLVHKTEDFWEALDDTAAKIAATVVGRVEDASMVALRRRPPENYEAFECVLRGIEHHRLGGVTDDNAREAKRWFNKAIEADPQYGAAYAWRVCASSWLPDFDFEEALRDGRRAIELDPCDPESNRILGYMEFMNGNDEAAKSLLARAAKLNPTDAYIKARSAHVTTYLGDPETALTLVDEAEKLDPLLPVYCIEERGVALYALARHAEALVSFERLIFQTFRSRLYRAASLVALGRVADAQRLCAEAVGGNSRVTLSGFLAKERFRDASLHKTLGERLEKAGLAG